MASFNIDNHKQSASENQSSSKAGIIAAIITSIIALALGSWGGYTLVRQRQLANPEYHIKECKSSIKRLERNLSKHAV